MHPRHDFANFQLGAQRIVTSAQRVVEDHDPRGAALGLHQRFHLRVINPPNLVFVEELADFGVVADEAKTFAVEHELARMRPAVMDDDAPGIEPPAAHVGRPARAGLG